VRHESTINQNESNTETLNDPFMRHLLALILIFSFSTAFSQNNKIDSLQQEVNKAKGTNRILKLNELAIAYWEVDLKKTIILGNEALRLAEQYKFYKAKARTFNIIGVAYYKLGNYEIANKLYDKCLETTKEHGSETDQYKSLSNKITLYLLGYRNEKFIIRDILDDFIKLCIKRKDYDLFRQVLINLIWVQTSTENTSFNAFEYVTELQKTVSDDFIPSIEIIYANYYRNKKEDFKAINTIKHVLITTKDKNILILCYSLLGDTYMYLHRFKMSKQYYTESLRIANQANSTFSSTYIPSLKARLGSVCVELRDYANARRYTEDYLFKNYSIGEFDKYVCYNNLGLAYLGLDSLSKAEYYVNLSVDLSKKINLKPSILVTLQSKVKLLKRIKKQNELNKTIKAITEIIDSVSDFYIVYDGYQILTDYYKSTGDYKKSLYYLEKWGTVNDSLKSTESLQVFNEFQTKYETEKKEQQIVLQDTQIKSQHRFLIVLSISGVLLLIAFAFIFILYNKRNQAYKRLVLQSIGDINNEELFDDSELLGTNNESEEVPDKIANQKNNNTLIDEVTKNLIKEELQKQLSDKVYLDDGLSINKLATLCNTNRTYLSQVINETYQMNFNTFINKFRIDEAKRLLLNESFETPLKHLSTQLGFKTYTVFNDAFKKFVGVTPAFFLRTVKAERDNN